MSLDEWRRQQILLGEAESAITQCCAILGDHATDRILGELSGKQQEIADRINSELGR